VLVRLFGLYNFLTGFCNLHIGLYNLDIGLYNLNIGLYNLNIGLYNLNIGLYNLYIGFHNLVLAATAMSIVRGNASGPELHQSRWFAMLGRGEKWSVHSFQHESEFKDGGASVFQEKEFPRLQITTTQELNGVWPTKLNATTIRRRHHTGLRCLRGDGGTMTCVRDVEKEETVFFLAKPLYVSR